MTIQIYPFSAQAYAALSGNFAHFVPDNAKLGTVLLEAPLGSSYLTHERQLLEYSVLFDRLTESALPPIDVSSAPEAHSVKDSLGLIQHLLYTL
ncbi:Scr1 family TA system antitoxin-like transcriptional regulator [Streptomyces sp. FR-108]|uniref:Scr1 family TA system antitoxin-like transcriptional regulator n=1 Tax=Streptomyces sp. FR-108 TaxID=3416665 RepID=UPI003CE67B7A